MEKKNGKGKMYLFDEGFKFEGEFKEGLRWDGKGYDGQNNIIYELKNGNGIIKEYYKQKLYSENEYKNGKKNGRGKDYDNDGQLIFKGEYLNGKKWNSKGYNGQNNIVYELKNGNGIVKEYNNGKLRFEGYYMNGVKNGKGKEYYGND